MKQEKGDVVAWGNYYELHGSVQSQNYKSILLLCIKACHGHC